jgi:tetratricopeptide (TPR) repeat protein
MRNDSDSWSFYLKLDLPGSVVLIGAKKDQIRGWKDIASYFGRDERTVKRWERQRNLPVRRIPGPGRANVYILVSELEAWLAAGNLYSSSVEQENAQGNARRNEQKDERSLSTPVDSQLLTAEPALTSNEWRSGTGTMPAPHAQRDSLLPSQGLVHPSHSHEPRTHGNGSRRLPLVLFLGIGLLVLAAALARGRLLAGRGWMFYGSLAARTPASSAQTRADALYFEGIYFEEQRTPASLDHALHSFQGAIAKDPEQARAYAGIATTYLLMREYGSMPEAEAYAKAEVAAERAAFLDSSLADAHAALGFIAFFSYWNPHRANQEFESSLRLDPASSMAHHWYGSMLTHQGLYSEALDQLNIAQQLEPTSAAILSSKAFALGLSGQREEAFELLQPLVTADRESPSPHRAIAALSIMEPRDIPRYLDESQRFAELRNDHDSLNRLTLASDTYKRDGEAAMWAVMLRNERALHPSAEHPTYFMIEALAALGQQEAAIRDMNILAKNHDFSMIGIGIDPLLDPLRHNPNFRRIEAVVGLKPAP